MTTSKMTYEPGTRVRCRDYNDDLHCGVIVDNLSVMVYVKFDAGHEVFVYKASKDLRHE